MSLLFLLFLGYKVDEVIVMSTPMISNRLDTYKLPNASLPKVTEKELGQIKPKGKLVPGDDRLDVFLSAYGEKRLKALGLLACETCSSRTYIDGSDDPSVSFKTPTKISPEASFAAVAAHENEHVANERANAHAENRDIVSQSVRIFMSTCPECGIRYASGGVTITQTAPKNAYDSVAPLEPGLVMDVYV